MLQETLMEFSLSQLKKGFSKSLSSICKQSRSYHSERLTVWHFQKQYPQIYKTHSKKVYLTVTYTHELD